MNLPARQPANLVAPAMLRDVCDGLRAHPKRLPSKYFYDVRGSHLFEEICAQPEYYLSRVELALLRRCGDEIAAALGPDLNVVEYGPGSGEKTRILLRSLPRVTRYVPIDVCRGALQCAVDALRADFPELDIAPVCGDFTSPLMATPSRGAGRVCVFFPGSTLGNFPDEEGMRLLASLRRMLGADGVALVGLDLVKAPAILEAAYNDAAGVTAEFTLNLLRRCNRELGTDFDLAAFQHHARYSAVRRRIETDLVSLRAQSVHVAGERYSFREGEAMRVEVSCKYDALTLDAEVQPAGLRVARRWIDTDAGYGLFLLRPRVSVAEDVPAPA